MGSKRLIHLAEYAAVMGAGAALRRLPHGAALKAGAALGAVAYKTLGIRREVAEANAAAALGWPAGGEEVKRLALDCYRNLGMSMAEVARMPLLGRAGFDKIVTIDGLEHFDSALSAGKGAVLATGHFGNWELMGAALAQRGYPMNFLVGHQTNRMVDAMLNSLRTRFGIGLVRHGAHVRKVLRLLERNQFVAMLCDHDAGRKGVMIRFFGRPASSVFGPASFALMSGSPIMMGFIYRDNARRHHVELTAPLYVPTHLPPGEAIALTTQRLADLIEARIRLRPDQWYWVHRRWKTTDARGLRGAHEPSHALR